MKAKMLLLCALVYWPLQLFAWGGFGHRTIATIAYKNLDPNVTTMVNSVLGTENFDDVASWADAVRPTTGWRQTTWYHFTKIDDGITYLQNLKALPPNRQALGDVIMAVLKGESILRDGVSSPTQKSYALKFIIHFVGDMHQPLHTGRVADSGGNSIPVTWFGQQTELHALWDTGIITTAHAKDINGMTYQQQADWYAAYLEKIYAPGKCDMDLETWENATLAVRPIAYVGYDGDNTTYMNKVLPTVESQIATAGYHLACVLNTLFGNLKATPQVEMNLRSKMDAIVGKPFESFITLQPVP